MSLLAARAGGAASRAAAASAAAATRRITVPSVAGPARDDEPSYSRGGRPAPYQRETAKWSRRFLVQAASS
jgi:hypothetical protein